MTVIETLQRELDEVRRLQKEAEKDARNLKEVGDRIEKVVKEARAASSTHRNQPSTATQKHAPGSKKAPYADRAMELLGRRQKLGVLHQKLQDEGFTITKGAFIQWLKRRVEVDLTVIKAEYGYYIRADVASKQTNTTEKKTRKKVTKKKKTKKKRALSSKFIYVRSQDHLARDIPTATGRRLSAWEVLTTFGKDVFNEIDQYGSAIIVANYDEPAKTLRKRRNILGLSIVDLAKYLNLKPADIEDAENPQTRTEIQILEKIAQAMGLSPDHLSHVPDACGDHNLAIRLRTMKDKKSWAGPKVVLGLGEAAWIIAAQTHLCRSLRISQKNLEEMGFRANYEYSSRQHPPWWYGYRLAAVTRKLLSIDDLSPIKNLRELVENILSIPVIQVELPIPIAGATIGVGAIRGIVLNTLGQNSNVWIRRATLAHELGHFLWDPDSQLDALKVDEYREIDRYTSSRSVDTFDEVEARANAFAVEFLAPRKAVKYLFDLVNSYSKGTRAVMDHFGISFTSARYHISKAFERKIQPEELSVEDTEPTDSWQGRESFTTELFYPKEVPVSRRGKFAWIIAKAEEAGFISSDTAAAYLGCIRENYDRETVLQHFR